MIVFDHEYYMREALKEARQAFDRGEVPVGAVIVSKGRIIARAHNLTECLHDVTAHAEMLGVTAAANYLGAKYLTDCQLYVTLEPCVMCAGALAWSQIGTIIYGASDAKRGFTAFSAAIAHPKTHILSGILADECRQLMQDFFKSKR